MNQIAVALLFIFLGGIAMAGEIPDTGQTKCYDDSVEIPCPPEEEDYYGQDGSYVKQRSYTVLSGGQVVQDNVTRLMWEVKTDDGSVHDRDNTYTWYDPNPDTNGGVAGTLSPNDTKDFIDALNNSNFGGYSDWRLPTIKELASIVNLGKYNPSIDETYFPNTMSSCYWSSSTCFNGTGYAWGVNFNRGNDHNYYTKAYDWYVRAVRGGQCYAGLEDNGDGTVTDTSTGLMWEIKTDDGGPQDKDNTYNWRQALGYCENLDLAGRTDWRLPDREELRSIIDYWKYNPSIDETYFPNVLSSVYWSSSTCVNNTGSAWYVHFSNGFAGNYIKNNSWYVRAVRGGQCGPFGPLVIAQSPMSGHPGTLFVQWGTGFTPEGSATLHLRKPDNTEYPVVEQPIDESGGFSIEFTVAKGETAGTYTWWAVDGPSGNKSNELSYVIESSTTIPFVDQNPMTGAPGSVLVQCGSGFTPGSIASLYLRKPDGTEYLTQKQPIDAVGRFSFEYTIPSFETDGTYSWWAVDGPTARKSKEVSYTVENGLSVATGNYNLANIQPGANWFQLWLDVSIDSAKPENFCDNYELRIETEGMPVEQTYCSMVGDGKIPNSNKYRIHFRIKPTDDSNAAYFENGSAYLVEKGMPENYAIIEDLDNFSVYGSTFAVNLHAWSFENGKWTLPSSVGFNNDFFKAGEVVADYLTDEKHDWFWNDFGRDRFFNPDRPGGGCYGLTHSAIANFTHQGEQAWGTDGGSGYNIDKDEWKQEIENHWDTVAKTPFKPFKTDFLSDSLETFDVSDAWTPQSAKKIMYYHVAWTNYRNLNWTGMDGQDQSGIRNNAWKELKSGEKTNLVNSLLKKGSPVSIYIKYFKDKGNPGKHQVAITQLLLWNNHAKYMIWDNNNPYSTTAKKGYGPFLEWYQATGTGYGSINCENPATGNGDGQQYKLSQYPLYLHPDGDSQNIYNLSTEKSRDLPAAKPEAEAGSISQNRMADSLPDHIQVTIIGADIIEVADDATGNPVTLVPNGELLQDQAVIETTTGGIFNFLYLPVDKTYRVEATKYAEFIGLKVFVSIPNADGTVENLNYENVAVSEDDATRIEFTVGRNNPDKAIRRNASENIKEKSADDYLPDYEGTSPVKIQPPENFHAVLQDGSAQLSWINPSHPDFAGIRIVRKEGSLPESNTDGLIIYEGSGEQFADSDISSVIDYGYAAYAADSSSDFSEAAYATATPHRFSVYGQVATPGGTPVAGAEIAIKNLNGRIVDTDISGSNGQYCFANLEMNHYMLEASHEDHQIVDPTREITLSDCNLAENFEAFPVPTLILLFDAEEVRTGVDYPVSWTFRHIDHVARVDVRLNRSGEWEQIVSDVPVIDGRVNWAVGDDPAEEAVLNVRLSDDFEVCDEHTLSIITVDSDNPKVVYVSPSGFCGEKAPCYSSVPHGMGNAESHLTVRIEQGQYGENVQMNRLGVACSLYGGYDSEFIEQSGFSTIDGSLEVTGGTLSVNNIVIAAPSQIEN